MEWSNIGFVEISIFKRTPNFYVCYIHICMTIVATADTAMTQMLLDYCNITYSSVHPKYLDACATMANEMMSPSGQWNL